MAKTVQIKPEEAFARSYADRLILEKLTELQSAMKLSEVADMLQGTGIGLATIRSLLASNSEKFAYNERRWVPAARLEGVGRPFAEAVRLLVDRFGGPMPLMLLKNELRLQRAVDTEEQDNQIKRLLENNPDLLVTEKGEVVLADWVFVANEERTDRALGLNGVSREEFEALGKKLEGHNWSAPGAIEKALAATAPVSLKALGAVAWSILSPQDPRAPLLFKWREFASKALSVPGYVFAPDGVLHKAEDAKGWISTAIKLAEKISPTVEVEDVAPIEVKSDDIERMVKAILASERSETATHLLETMYEITPSVKTFPDDLHNVLTALQADSRVWWVGGDRFRKPNSAPDFIYSVPELFEYVPTTFTDEDGDLVDIELTDDGLSSSLRKLISHPLATDVLDEDIMPAPKSMAEQLRLVLKPIHRELGTFPMCQIPSGWLPNEPDVQELIFINPAGQELQVWANTKARLLFNLIDWWYEQPAESGAVFSLTRTGKTNVFEFAWLDQTDPVVFISNQRMEELREIQGRSEGMSTLDILREVMSHWPKGADFLTILWETNVVRRAPRRLIASLLSSYHSFYQRSGSPVWHYDSKKVEQGVDKTKKKFIKK